MADRVIEVSENAVRRALVRSFTELAPAGHAWRGTVGVGDSVVAVDVLELADGSPYVHATCDVVEAGALDGRLARVLVIENAELVLGRFGWEAGRLRIEHAILAGTTMAAVEVQASVWTVGWAASAFAPRMRALMQNATPVPAAPETPAARLRDAADHVRMTTGRVQHTLERHYGRFDHHPDWGFHGGFGSARVFVDVLPVLDDSTAVRASSPVLSDVDLSEAMGLRLIELTAEHPFGAFMYLPARREVWFQHAILGDDLDERELALAIDVVAEVADGSDDRLAAEFGGQRYADLG